MHVTGMLSIVVLRILPVVAPSLRADQASLSTEITRGHHGLMVCKVWSGGLGSGDIGIGPPSTIRGTAAVVCGRVRF